MTTTTDEATPDESLTIDAEGSMTVEAVPGEDRELSEAEELAVALSVSTLTDHELPTILAVVEAVLVELDAREARSREGDHIDIESMVDDLEIGELKLLEEATGLKLARILREFESNEFGADTIAAIVWISLRRDDPEATIEDADKVKLRQIAEVDDDEDAVPDPL